MALTMTKYIQTLLILAFSLITLAACSPPSIVSQNFSNQQSNLSMQNVNLDAFPNDPTFWQGDTQTVWDRLQHVPLQQLQASVTKTTDPTTIAWINLAIISKQYSVDTMQLTTQLMAWRAANPSHPGNALFPSNSTLTSLQTMPRPKHIALLLPLQGQLGNSGQTVRDGLLNAYYSSGNTANQAISFYDTSTSTPIAALYQQAITEGADTVIGPLTKPEVQALASQGNFPVTTLALNYTDSWGSLPSNFYEFGLSPQDESQQMADRARQAGLSRTIIIAPSDEWGQRVVKAVVDRWKTLGGSITDTFYFTNDTDLNAGIANLLHVNAQADRKKMQAHDSKNVLEQQRRQDFDVVFLFAPPQMARQIVPLLRYYYVNTIPIYATSIVYSGTPAPQKDIDLNGVIFCDTPWTLQMGGTNHPDRLYAVGRDAYFISTQIPRLKMLANFPLYGATGALTLTPQQKIYRRLAWTQIHDGNA